LQHFFKNYKIHKGHTIKKLLSKGVGQTQAYRAFDFIANLINAKVENNYYSFEEIKAIMVTK
jgi:hypothetical protein